MAEGWKAETTEGDRAGIFFYLVISVSLSRACSKVKNWKMVKTKQQNGHTWLDRKYGTLRAYHCSKRVGDQRCTCPRCCELPYLHHRTVERETGTLGVSLIIRRHCQKQYACKPDCTSPGIPRKLLEFEIFFHGPGKLLNFFLPPIPGRLVSFGEREHEKSCGTETDQW